MTEKKEYKPYEIDQKGLEELIKKAITEQTKRELIEKYSTVFDKNTFEIRQCDLTDTNAMFKEIFNELIETKTELATTKYTKKEKDAKETV